MRKRARAIGEVSLSALEDQWQRDATVAAIAGARGVIRHGGPIPPGTPVGRLSDTERVIRMTGIDPAPWDIGAAIAILPELAAASADIDWGRPLTAWSREDIT